MAITYPLTLPAYPAPANVRITANNAVALSESPYTGAQQVQEWPNESWSAEWSLPMLLADQAGQWRGFLAALRGISGTFLMGPAGLVAPRGTQGTIYNLLNYSEAFTATAYWKTFNVGASDPVVTDNAVTDPFGSSHAASIAFPSTTSGQASEIFQQSAPVVLSGQVFTASIWLRANSATTITLLVGSAVTVNQLVNVTTSWQRYSVSMQYDTSSPRGTCGIALRSQNQSATTIYAWGAQVERGAYDPSTYQNTGVQPFVDTTTGLVAGSKQVRLDWTVAGTSLLAGDWFQIGQHLYIATQDATQADNALTVDIYPRLRNDATSGSPVYFVDPVGIWRLAENPRSWGVQPASIHDFSAIKCREAL